VTYSQESCKSLITFNLRPDSTCETVALLRAVRNFLAHSRCQFFQGSFLVWISSISSILNREATRQHSPLSGALLDAKHFTLYLNGEASHFIGDSL
jgi:hypothetical protein